jgi:hypothetical protein
MRQVVPLHTRPVWQRRPAQHASFEPPQGGGGASETPTSGTGCVVSLLTSRGASCCVTSERGESLVVSILVSLPGAVSFET